MEVIDFGMFDSPSLIDDQAEKQYQFIEFDSYYYFS